MLRVLDDLKSDLDVSEKAINKMKCLDINFMTCYVMRLQLSDIPSYTKYCLTKMEQIVISIVAFALACNVKSFPITCLLVFYTCV